MTKTGKSSKSADKGKAPASTKRKPRPKGQQAAPGTGGRPTAPTPEEAVLGRTVALGRRAERNRIDPNATEAQLREHVRNCDEVADVADAMMRARNGQTPMFASAQELWEVCADYIDWNRRHPLINADGKPVARPLTIQGLCIFIPCGVKTWYEWRNERPDLQSAIQLVEQEIWKQKFEGANAGIYNANLIARDLQIAEQQVRDHRSSDGSMSPKAGQVTIDVSKLSKGAMKELLAMRSAQQDEEDPE